MPVAENVAVFRHLKSHFDRKQTRRVTIWRPEEKSSKSVCYFYETTINLPFIWQSKFFQTVLFFYPDKMKNILLLLCLAFPFLLNAQTNVRGWYADGQVWIVWEVSSPLPDWYSIYVRPSVFTSTTDAIRVGKLHKFEYACAQLKEQIDTSATPRIPAPLGSGKYQLAPNEALFVFTPHQQGALYFAVAANDATTVTIGQNITALPVPFQYHPDTDPVECHLQAVFPSPFALGFNCLAFMMWADGRQNQWESRPDFPIMANGAKNGMPSLFMISVPIGLDTTQAFPLSVWLHGGGGTARQSLAGSRPEANIRPEAGILLSHDDNLIGWRGVVPPFIDMPSWHFGWRKNYDPFQSNNLPSEPDTIVNYTQRRYWWIDEWLIKHFNIDSTRIQVHGHSMGSAGSIALVKCNPNHYASATIYNSGLAGPEPGSNIAVLGEVSQNFPTNLTDRNGATVRLGNLFNLTDNCAPERDWPIIRHWHGKNDMNATMHWSPLVVENFRIADSLGTGVQSMWSERDHNIDMAPDFNDHWIQGVPPDQQTALDNVNYPESRFRSNQSYPAFFNHRLDPQNNDPGTGLIGINNGDGDNWGAWGGYHRWETATLVEQAGIWSVVAWLESGAVFPNDNCPNNSLSADVAIRRPQLFKPATGAALQWQVREVGSSAILQSGQVNVQDDDLVVIPQVTVYREDIRRVRIIVADPSVATSQPVATETLALAPNPGSGSFSLEWDNTEFAASALVDLMSVSGEKVVSRSVSMQGGHNRITLEGLETLPAGIYQVVINTGKKIGAARWVKL